MIDEMEIVRRYTSQPPTQIIPLIQELGVAYEELSLPRNESGIIEFDGSQFKISVDANESLQRKRFTAAHEIAHYLLHRDLLKKNGRLNRHNDFLFGESAKSNPAYPFQQSHEVQANRYAAELLMPAERVREIHQELGDNLEQLAQRFSVSSAAMRIRLQNLGLANE